MKTLIKKKAKQLLRYVFRAGQQLGFDLLPRHFYSEIPNMKTLRTNNEWKKEYSMTGVSMLSLEKQLDFLKSLLSPKLEKLFHSQNIMNMAIIANGTPGYGPIEAEALFAFVYSKQPKKIIQVGCGVSTAICLAAAKMAQYTCQVTCIEPYPTDYLKHLHKEKIITLIDQPLEKQNSSLVEILDSGDLFFIDSSHTLGPAGEVTRIILEFLPRLKQGVYAHFHDIWMPYDYTPKIFDALFFHHETALLHAFITNNSNFRIESSMSLLHYKKAKDLKTIFPNYTPAKNKDGIRGKEGDFPSATYLLRYN